MRLVVTQHFVDISFLKNITYILGLNSNILTLCFGGGVVVVFNIYGQMQSLEVLGGSP